MIATFGWFTNILKSSPPTYPDAPTIPTRIGSVISFDVLRLRLFEYRLKLTPSVGKSYANVRYSHPKIFGFPKFQTFGRMVCFPQRVDLPKLDIGLLPATQMESIKKVVTISNYVQLLIENLSQTESIL